MALVLKDRVKESTTTTGTSDFVLGGADTGFQTFAAVGNGNTTYYTAYLGSEWEVGIGTYSTTGPTLARTTVLASSTGSKVSFSAGTKSVFLDWPSGKTNIAPQGLMENCATISDNYTITTGNNAISAGPITVASGVTVTIPSGSVWVVS